MKNLLNVNCVKWNATTLHLTHNCITRLLLLLHIITLHVSVVNAEWNPTHPDPIIEYHYSYDNVGNITAIEDSVKNSTSTFTYDEVDRLTQAIGSYGAGETEATVNYSYNDVGDIQGVEQPTTDGNGNALSYGNKTIEYDYENRPVKITDTATGVITEFGYDYSGQRVWKAVTNGTEVTETLYVGNIYEVHISSTGVETQTAHIYAGSLRVASRVTDSVGSRTFYYLGDHLGSTRMMTDALGQTVHDVTYEPWGSTVTESSTTYHANYKFTGQALDDSTDLYYYGARYYDPTLRRFITPDTIVQSPYDPQSLNRYAYCRNNPIIYVDPTGRSWLSETWSWNTWKNASKGSALWVATTPEGHQWWNENRYYVATGALILATCGAGSVFAAGTFGNVVFTSALMGEISGATFAGISAARHGGDVGRAMFTGAAIGGAQGLVTGGLFYGIENAGMNPIMEIALKGHVGGVMTAMMGGDYGTGFMYMAGAAALNEIYTAIVGYGPNPHPGEPLPDGTYDPNINGGRPPQGKAVFGANEPLNGHGDFWKQAGTIGKIGNRVPIGNAIANLHDTWVNNIINFNQLKNIGTMLGAAPLTIGAAMGSCWAPLTVNIAEGESR